VKYVGIVLLLGLGLAAPFFAYPEFLMQCLCFALFASAFNLLFGYTGILSFGHAAFFGSAAYICGHTVKVMDFTPELGILAGALTAGLLGFVIGGLAIRRQGIYFAMITLALAEVVYFVALQAPFTGGEDGLQSVPRGHLFGVIDLSSSFVTYYFVLAIFIGCSFLIHRIVHSPFGQILKAIRENETRAVSLGYTVDLYKLTAFVLSATLSGIAGATKVLVLQFASLSDVFWHKSGEVVLMTLLGGIGTLAGPPVGAVLVVGLNEYLAGLGEWVTFIIGAIFVGCVLAFRGGIVGELAGWIGKLN
jgi:branched-chain amino acid transport system permease protein